MADPYRLGWEDQQLHPQNTAPATENEKYYFLHTQVNELRDKFNELVDKSAVKWVSGYEGAVCWYPNPSTQKPEFWYTLADVSVSSIQQPGTGAAWIKQSSLDGGYF